jgi:SAM-dependent methyltransferase
MLHTLKRSLNNQFIRDEFVRRQLAAVPSGALLLDAGCGSQRYRGDCSHLQYRGQDFGQYSTDTKKMLGTIGVGGISGYGYGPLDYVGDIWNIQESNSTFDAILCTEVFEHIPYPNETIEEFARLLKPGGRLILTAPSNCLRHMDPYFYYSGFSDRWYQKILSRHGLQIRFIEPVGDYYRWMAVETARSMKTNSPLSWLALLPALLYYYFKKPSERSRDTLCMGYHVVAERI